MPQDLTDDRSTLFQVMAWCRQAPSHYLSQCWPRSLPPYSVTRPNWVNAQCWCIWLPEDGCYDLLLWLCSLMLRISTCWCGQESPVMVVTVNYSHQSGVLSEPLTWSLLSEQHPCCLSTHWQIHCTLAISHGHLSSNDSQCSRKSFMVHQTFV